MYLLKTSSLLNFKGKYFIIQYFYLMAPATTTERA